MIIGADDAAENRSRFGHELRGNVLNDIAINDNRENSARYSDQLCMNREGDEIRNRWPSAHRESDGRVRLL